MFQAQPKTKDDNTTFEKLKEQKTEANAEELEAFESKKAYIETIKGFELIGEHKADLDAILVFSKNLKPYQMHSRK